MARKRMLSREVIETDNFYNLSKDAQALYLHLNLNADDDGFVNNALMTCRMLGVNISVINELVTLGYLIKVNNGVYLIRHWLLNNNKIPNDRYKESIYKEFLDNNIIYDEESENKIYELREPEEQEQDKH